MTVRLSKRGGEALGVGKIQVDDLRILTRGLTDRSPAWAFLRVSYDN